MADTSGPKFHVLAVDDSLVDRMITERILKSASYQVTSVDSGSKALEFLGLLNDHPNTPSCNQETEVNLVITDYCMPGMTGYDLLKKIKENSPLKNIPVVIMSSENEPSRISRCLKDGAEEFFLKPMRFSDVERLLPHMIKGKHRDEEEEDDDDHDHDDVDLDTKDKEEETDEQLDENEGRDCSSSATTLPNDKESGDPPTAAAFSEENNRRGSKRRTMKDGVRSKRSLSPNRTRPRFTVAACLSS